MFNIDELGPEVKGNEIRFRIYLPGIEESKGFYAKVYVIDKRGQFDVDVPATPYDLAPAAPPVGADAMWGDVAKTLWQSEQISAAAGRLPLPVRDHRPRARLDRPGA